MILFFQLFWGGYLKELKDQGRLDTTHKEEIPTSSMVKLQELLVLLQNIQQCPKKLRATLYPHLTLNILLLICTIKILKIA